jgi:hypothetical protein
MRLASALLSVTTAAIGAACSAHLEVMPRDSAQSAEPGFLQEQVGRPPEMGNRYPRAGTLRLMEPRCARIDARLVSTSPHA